MTKQSQKQPMLPLAELARPSPAKKTATALMKIVAEKAPDKKKMEKVFSKDELNEIEQKSRNETEEERLKKELKKEQYRAIKRRVREMEIGNQSRIIVFPSLMNGERWYKLIEFSALYYAYRLAPRMGRKARVMKDSDRFSKAHFVTSLTNIEKFAEQIKDYEENITIDITEDGVYIFNLEKPVSDDEVAMLYRTEETRRERLHNVLKPKDMDPAVFSALLMVERQLLPRVKKLERNYYDSIGKTMAEDIHKTMTTYGLLTDGILKREEAGVIILKHINSLAAGLILLAELRIWSYEVAALIGENTNILKRLVLKDFLGEK